VSDDAEPPDYALVMPFVVCRSQGGPYDDDSFVAGYELGRLDAELPVLAALNFDSISRQVPTPCVEQLDLIAMRHGYRVNHVGYEHDGWTDVDLDRTDEG
jgi:hypothetical protein